MNNKPLQTRQKNLFIIQRTWVTDFRINPEFRILRLNLRKVNLKMLNSTHYSSISDLYTGYLKVIDHLNLRLLIFCRHSAIIKI